ncbi:putative prolipoprotein diacylglyceryl transferase [Diaporthe ampelina]|uniref:Putative prolipoprotein diacylglyceryl transferase n=1 Tax=Diaporthe ampelina TaxID=1214573 RepID=A0A0G2FIE0_9PEZI|nr:putative prolipoprotein diacylglyceryl transferase [Diaporthe ampelina]
MSLNGLDDAAVKEAYEAAVAEPGGWFLLKYTSRDEVDVLAKGNGGTVDMRNNIAQYEETSPLFGLLRYRRRNVIIKYLPEGCSRLIQARLAVHFNAVCERFAPYDTTFDIAEAKELKDTKLSAACSLHTASESTSSSTSSLRRRRLMEIAEEEEGEQRTAKRQSTVEEEEDHQSDIDPTESRPRSPITGPPVTLDPQLASSPEASQFADSTEPPSFIGAPRPASPAKSFETDTGRRLSSQSSRQDYYSSSSYYNKPRVKLGPRPSIDPAGKQGSSGSVRPVASMPASLKLSFKGAKRTKTQDDSSSVISEEPGDNAFLTPTIPIPEDSSLLQALRPRTSGGRPSTSSGVSVKSLPSISAPTKNTMTPEKMRLMKAMQLREKKKRASAQPPPVPSVQVTADPEEPETAVGEDETRDETQTSSENDQASDHLSLAKIDSEGDNASAVPTDHASVRTQTDSRPPSPICASSEVGDSTKASSVSDSTEETIQGQGDKNEHEHGQDAGSAQEADTLKQDDARPGEVPAAGPDDAGIENGPGVEGQEVSQAQLTQTEQQPYTEDVQREVKEKATLVQKDQPAEHSFIPTSKFAKALNGQAVVEHMGPDPQEVTSVPGRIDEVGPTPVGPAAERTQDGSAASPPKWNLPISKYSTHDSSKTLAPSPIPAIVTSSTDTPDGDDQVLANAADTMEAESASSEKRSKRPDPINTDLDLPDKEPVQEDEQPAGEPQSATIQEAKPVIIASPVASPVTATSQEPTKADPWNRTPVREIRLTRPQEAQHDHESSPLELKQSPLIIDHRKGAETPEWEPIPDAAPPVPTPLVHAGEPQPRDVNVQFPDNLLWKRRTVSLDTIGYLLLNAVQGVTSIREKQLKRYHLSEFKPPYAPEIEFQELPNSVCLDFIDGSSLQIAFQDRAGQLNGLHTLQENHRKHISAAS